MQRDVFVIEAMDCPTEEQLIRNRLKHLPEVVEMEFDLTGRRLIVDHRFESDAPILAALREIGMSPSAAAGEPPRRIQIRQRWVLGAALLMALGSELVAWGAHGETSVWTVALALGAIALSAPKMLRKGLAAVRTFTLNMNFLMTVAVVGAAVIGQWPEGAMVCVLFAIAETIEARSLDRARHAVRGLMAMEPDRALVQTETGEWEEADAALVPVGAVVRVRPGERAPFDGVVVAGESAMDQAPITGESIPIDKAVGDRVFAGTINGWGALDLRVTANKGSTTLDRIIATVQEAQASRAPTQRFVDSFAAVYTPAMVILAFVVAAVPPIFLGHPVLDSVFRALVVLVIACPCALVVSTPVTVVSALATAARHGILIKGGVHLENGRKLKVVALDKTGTLTRGTPSVTDVRVLGGGDERSALQVAASLDALSDHPVARAVTAAWDGPRLPVEGFVALGGRGVSGTVGGTRYFLGNHRLVEENGLCGDHVERTLLDLEDEGKTVAVLTTDERAIALVAVADTLRETSMAAVAELHKLGIPSVILTGDNEATAKAIARKSGVDGARAELLPEDKLRAVRRLSQEYGPVGMVGDGVNDAPAMALATVGFAMGGAGTDTALETADVAFMDDDLRKLPEYVRLSRRTGRVLAENITLAVGIKAVFLALAVTGHATLWMAVFADMGASLIVVANALRLTRSRRLRALARGGG